MTQPLTPGSSSTASALFSGSVSFAELYERFLVGPLFRPWAERLLDRIPLRAAARVLDVACGTGIVARVARQRMGPAARVVGVDRSPIMLGVARSIDATIDWREGDAAALPVTGGERFDVALCHQGLQFFPDKLGALREMRRVLDAGGRVGISVWRSLEENSLFSDLGRVAERFVGPIEDARHSFADADTLARLLSDAGFTDVKVEPMSMTTRMEIDPPLLARLNANAVIGMSEAGKGMSDEHRAEIVSAIVEASAEVTRKYMNDGALAFQTSSNVATACA